MNVRLDISYDGASYGGFQVQENSNTIQGELERALAVLYKQPVRIVGAGRTDAGVHARGQVAHYRAPFEISAANLPAALNSVLPDDIVVVGAKLVSANFHARFQARRKIYSYTIDRAKYVQVMRRNYSFHVPGPLDLAAMIKGARLLEGKHDFAAFQATGRSVRDTVRTLYRVGLHDSSRQQLLRLEFEGDGFLYKMVRLLTGSLLRVGRGKLAPEDLAAALEGRNPSAAGPAAPPHGLCLERVVYNGDEGTGVLSPSSVTLLSPDT